MGADYIPEDNILTRQTRERTDLLLKSAQEANFNSLRVWGGGYFLDDFSMMSAMREDSSSGMTLCLPAHPTS